MLTGHTSHQVGLDADIWLMPMPNRQLSRNEREEMSANNMVRADRLDIDPAAWTPSHLLVIRAAAQEPRVERIFVNAAIKKALCREAKGDRSWLAKVRPMYGHDYHFHVRITCPHDDTSCKPQPPPPDGEGWLHEIKHDGYRLMVRRSAGHVGNSCPFNARARSPAVSANDGSTRSCRFAATDSYFDGFVHVNVEPQFFG